MRREKKLMLHTNNKLKKIENNKYGYLPPYPCGLGHFFVVCTTLWEDNFNQLPISIDGIWSFYVRLINC